MPYKIMTPERKAKAKKIATQWMRDNRVEMNARREARRADPAYRAREYQKNILGKWKLTLEQMNMMWINQLFGCAICETPFETPFDGYVDHDHKTGAVRGLLCNNCNTGIGMLKDDPRLLARGIAYLCPPGTSGRLPCGTN